jgi:tRNA (guanine10-N2)-dimethyltransferase
VRPGDRVADPFAGTGGLLLEAGLAGAAVLGADLDPVMVEGSRDALAHYGVAGDIAVGDVAETLARMAAAAPLDAIVSDPPYGRSSTTAREPPRELYGRALAAMASALKPGGRLAIVLPDPEAAKQAPPSLVLEQAHVQRVHRSLDRHYLVFRKA